MPAISKEERVFNQSGRRHYRRTYSSTEVRLGALVLVGLAAVASWVAWRGANPEAALFAAAPGLKYRTLGMVDRGPVPADLAPAGWVEGALAQFGPDNLYEKINGRAGYYKGFGFKRLHYISLNVSGQPEVAIDVELYDLGTAANALGAYAGERGEEAAAQRHEGGVGHIARNALLMTRGPFYARVIGADESPAVVAALKALRTTLIEALPSEAMPWAFELFGAVMGAAADRIAYHAENAFSFGFAGDVYVLTGEADTESFVVAAADEAAASKLAGQFNAGFAQLGEPVAAGGVTWAADRYLSTLSGARAVGRFVIGVRGAATAESAASSIAELESALKRLDPATIGNVKSATPAPAPPAEEEGYEQ